MKKRGRWGGGRIERKKRKHVSYSSTFYRNKFYHLLMRIKSEWNFCIEMGEVFNLNYESY